MGLVPAKCTSCCGTLEVDAELKAAICPHCGSAYIVQEAINQYNVTNVYQINKASLKVDHRQLFADRIEAAEKQMRFLKDYPKALNSFTALENDVPEEFRVWSGKLEARSMGYDAVATSNIHIHNDNCLKELCRDYENAYTTGDEEQKKEINEKFITLLKQCFEKIKSAENIMVNNEKARHKYRSGSNLLAKLKAVFLMLALILGVIALVIVGFMVLSVIVGGAFGSTVDGKIIAEALVFSGITFSPTFITLVIVIILGCFGKKNNKKYNEISNETARIIREELRLDLPGFVPQETYEMNYMLCGRKANYLYGIIEKYSQKK